VSKIGGTSRMISAEGIRYSLRNLWSRKSRSALTIFSIFIGIATIFIFISFGFGLHTYIENLAGSTAADKIIVQAKGVGAPGLDDTFALTEEDLDVVGGVSGIAEVTGMKFKVAEVQKRGEIIYSFIMSYDPDKPMIFDFVGVGLESGKWLRKGDTGKVLLGYNYLVDDRVFPRGYEINDEVEISGQTLRVVGFVEEIGNPQDDSPIYITQKGLEEIYGSNVSYGWIMGRVKDLDEIDKVIEQTEDKLRRERNQEEGKEDFFVQSFQDMIESYSGALDIVIGFVILIALISVFVSAINTAKTMITSVLERYKEIGIMKAVGARNKEVFGIFLFESAFLGFIAGIIGVLIGWGISAFAGFFLNRLGWGFLSPIFSWQLFVGCILFALITGGISGIIPAFNASRTNIVDALRYE
jgi:putative ABC transport system permease protein